MVATIEKKPRTQGRAPARMIPSGRLAGLDTAETPDLERIAGVAGVAVERTVSRDSETFVVRTRQQAGE